MASSLFAFLLFLVGTSILSTLTLSSSSFPTDFVVLLSNHHILLEVFLMLFLKTSSVFKHICKLLIVCKDTFSRLRTLTSLLLLIAEILVTFFFTHITFQTILSPFTIVLFTFNLILFTFLISLISWFFFFLFAFLPFFSDLYILQIFS